MKKDTEVAKNMRKFIFFIKEDKFKKLKDGDYSNEETPYRNAEMNYEENLGYEVL